MNGCSAVHLSIFGCRSSSTASEAMRQKYLPDVASGQLHVAFGVTEPDAGTDTTSIRTFAEKVEGGYFVRGQKFGRQRRRFQTRSSSLFGRPLLRRAGNRRKA